jgi:hypothetical protein
MKQNNNQTFSTTTHGVYPYQSDYNCVIIYAADEYQYRKFCQAVGDMRWLKIPWTEATLPI